MRIRHYQNAIGVVYFSSSPCILFESPIRDYDMFRQTDIFPEVLQTLCNSSESSEVSIFDT